MPEKQLESGDIVQILSKSYELHIETGKRNTIKLVDNKLLMTLSNDDFQTKQRLLDSAKKKLMEAPLLELCDKVYSIFKPLGVEYPKEIRIKNMKSRWGSCNAAKKILAFSTMLSSMPMPFVEYVVVHEFAHLVYPNHSKDFYKLIETIMPDYKARRAMGKRF
jgi:predicted metal-dependent hydrolase